MSGFGSYRDQDMKGGQGQSDPNQQIRYSHFGSWLCRNVRRFLVEAGALASSAVFGGLRPVFRIFGVWTVVAGSGALERRVELEVA